MKTQANYDDEALSACVRSALEEDIKLNQARIDAISAAATKAVHRQRILHLVRRWGSVSLVAASIAFAFCLRAISPASAPADVSDELSVAIGFLSEIDGVSVGEASARSSGELLLAWQDAPCADLL